MPRLDVMELAAIIILPFAIITSFSFRSSAEDKIDGIDDVDKTTKKQSSEEIYVVPEIDKINQDSKYKE